jgi:hypothetical protein
VPRGGARQGEPGKAYPNRKDLTQAPSAAKGQQYGKATEQMTAQKVVPLPQSSVAAGAGPSHAQATRPAPGAVAFDRPTDRPSEPVTAGLPFGPGPGPEALGPMGPAAEAQRFKPYLPMLEHLASQPYSTPTVRNFVRRLRSLSG